VHLARPALNILTSVEIAAAVAIGLISILAALATRSVTALWLFILIISLIIARRAELAGDIERLQRSKQILTPRLYWGLATAFTLSGVSLGFSIFGFTTLGLDINQPVIQAFTILSLIALIPIYYLARRLTKPAFELHGTPQKERQTTFIFLVFFWMAGFYLCSLVNFL
jgi:hypothetical protein